jgi:hypothetical protein
VVPQFQWLAPEILKLWFACASQLSQLKFRPRDPFSLVAFIWSGRASSLQFVSNGLVQ